MDLDLDLDATPLAICRLRADAAIPGWVEATAGPLVAVVRTRDELSIVAAEAVVPAPVRSEPGWRAMAVRGPLDFATTGVLASLAQPLADAGVPIFAISTFDTDWLLVRHVHLEDAVAALQRAGHRVHR